jgi:hypothetical protein
MKIIIYKSNLEFIFYGETFEDILNMENSNMEEVVHDGAVMNNIITNTNFQNPLLN